jgi:hypothetical protein
VRQHLYTVLLFLAVVASTLVLALGGIYTWVAIQQRNQAGETALQILNQIQQRQAPQQAPAPVVPQPEQGGEPQQ